MNIKSTLKRCAALAAFFVSVVALSACSFLGDQADKRLGITCGDESRVTRAALLTDMLAHHWGVSAPDQIIRLKSKVDLMQRAAAAGSADGLDAAGDSYRLDFVGFVIKVLAARGKQIAISGFDEALERLRELPTVGADINAIEAKILTSCKEQSAGVFVLSRAWGV